MIRYDTDGVNIHIRERGRHKLEVLFSQVTIL